MIALGVAAAPAARAGGGPYIGPLPYLSAADNPFLLASGLCIDTFEDGTLTPGGVTGNGSFVNPGGITDSVDFDDGSLDGSGTGGHTYFGSGPTGITFTFDPQRTGGLPTQAGMVWTDGAGTVTFEAFDQNGASLGMHGPFDHPDGSISGETAEDRFYGATNAGGISAIKLTNTSGGIEVDHLTLNNTSENCEVGVPTTTTSTTVVATTSTTLVTTTTTLPGDCAGAPVGPSFESLNCRLAALITAVQAESQLGKQQPKLDKAARKAKERKEAAEAECAAGDTKAAGRQLKKVVRKLIQFSHRLRSNNSRKNIPEQIREPLAQAADRIQEEARELKGTLGCAG
jgi:hypothetical protein